ncbi:hypothetical protein ACFJGX_14235 [Hydrogenophaga sp. UC242_50]|uniref:hypothetical protein n=1 Tax=unclassified Hydrogenophaga TaxID=2610897 RepID=UPI0036D2E050
MSAPTGPNGEVATSIAGPIASSGTEVRAQAWRYIATGAWSAGTRTFTPSASEQWTAAVLKVRAGEFDASTPVGATATRASAGGAENHGAVARLQRGLDRWGRALGVLGRRGR